MSCLFVCFRAKNSRSNIVTPPEPVVQRSRNALSSLFLSDDDSVGNGAEGSNPLHQDLDVRKLKDEVQVKFRKACETVSETPKFGKEGIPAQIGEEKSSKFNSWILEESPVPVQTQEDWITGSGSSLGTSSSCITDGRNTSRSPSSSIQRSDIHNVINPILDSETQSETSSVSTQVLAPKLQLKSRSGSFDSRSVRKSSPHPTPVSDMAIGEVEIPSKLQELKDENSDSNHLRESNKLHDESASISTSTSETMIKCHSVDNEMDETSLSSFLKPPSAKQYGNKKQFGSASAENVYRVRVPVDRPILGMVAAHWNDDEKPHVSPKWWDGNGIPNSTNKYKEDQKVSWHATPFEERLEKALSEETSISQRKSSRSHPVELDENEESDTALSHMQSSAHMKSVFSF